MKRFVLLLIVLLAGVCALQAQTVEMIVIESDTVTSPRTLALSEFMISGGLDVLFGQGIIGTNQRPRPGTKQDFLDIVPTYESLSGGIDLLLILYVRYGGGDQIVPEEVEFRVMQVDSRTIRKSGMVRAQAPINATPQAAEQASLETGKKLVESLLASLYI